MIIFQALKIIEEVGDLIRLRYSRLPLPDVSEKDIELVEVTANISTFYSYIHTHINFCCFIFFIGRLNINVKFFFKSLLYKVISQIKYQDLFDLALIILSEISMFLLRFLLRSLCFLLRSLCFLLRSLCFLLRSLCFLNG